MELQPDSVREDDDGDSASTSNSDSDPSFLRHLFRGMDQSLPEELGPQLPCLLFQFVISLELDPDPENELEAVGSKKGGRTTEVNEPEGREFGSFLVSPIHPILK